MKEKLIALKGKRDNSEIVVRDFSTHLFPLKIEGTLRKSTKT